MEFFDPSGEGLGKEFFATETPATRKIAMRSALTLSPDRGGVFDALLGLVRHWLGGTMGKGTQYVSWIHDADFVRAIEFLIAREDLAGVVNLASPHPLPNRLFMRALRQAWCVCPGVPMPEWVLHMGAILLGTETELILKSRRVVPGRLLAGGFTFRSRTGQRLRASWFNAGGCSGVLPDGERSR